MTAQDHRKYLIMSPNLVRARWDELAADPDNPRPELGVDEWLAEAEAGNIVVGGYQVVLQSKLPEPAPEVEGLREAAGNA